MQKETSSRNIVVSARLSAMTRKQLTELTEQCGCSTADIITIAIDRMYQQEIKTMTIEQANRIATAAINRVKLHDFEIVANTVTVGKDHNGYWVTDNGEEVANLTKEKAIQIIVENLIA